MLRESIQSSGIWLIDEDDQSHFTPPHMPLIVCMQYRHKTVMDMLRGVGSLGKQKITSMRVEFTRVGDR